MDILFRVETREFSDEYVRLIENAAERTLEIENVTGDMEISMSVVDNEAIRELNNKFRGIDRATDVLSFPMYGSIDSIKKITEAQNMVMLGDIVISLEKAQEQALEFGHGIGRELSFLTVHGMLHLLGYDHMTADDEREMFEKQDRILESLGSAK